MIMIPYMKRWDAWNAGHDNGEQRHHGTKSGTKGCLDAETEK